MNSKMLRLVLLFYFFILLASPVASFFESEMISEDLVAKADAYIGDEMSLRCRAILVSLALSILLIGLFGLLGMFFLWSKARYLFTISIFLAIILQLVEPWGIHTRWSTFLGNVEALCAGIIISLTWWGPAKTLFEEKKKLEK